MAKAPKPPRRAGLSGVLVLDKPSGPTSFDVVAQVRRHYRVKSVGHAGTLDPLASGVLVVMLGEATKLSEYLTAADKHYIAEVTFGRSTDTLDVDGQTVEERALLPGELTQARVLEALAAERARLLQFPPAFSAIKQGGETAYSKARRGETVQLPARPIRVEALALEALTASTAQLDVRVGKGYYVRSLARDVSDFLKVPGCLSALRRVASGIFTLEGAIPWPPAEGETPPLLSTTSAARLALPNATLTPEGELRARQGKRLTTAHFTVIAEASPAAWLSESGLLVAIGERVVSEAFATDARPGSSASDDVPGPRVLEEAQHEPASIGPEFRVLRGFQTVA
jgi:tRNA pseudouridine55 synthase